MQGRMMILLQKQQLVHKVKGRSRDQIMAAVPVDAEMRACLDLAEGIHLEFLRRDDT